MSRSFSADVESVDRFLRTQRFRDKETRRIYGHILRAFVSEYFTGAPLSLQEWLEKSGGSGLFTWSAIGLDCGAVPGMGADPWRDLRQSLC